jgi:putative chitinase
MDIDLFFDRIRQAPFKGRMSASQVAGTKTILDAMEGWPTRWVAYGLATALHEVGGTMQPIAEKGGNAYFTRMYDIRGERPALAKRKGNTMPGDGIKYRGRGYVQLTWAANYTKAAKVVGADLVAHPDLAMRPDYAALILRDGMERGWFTGKKLADYLSDTKSDYRGARRIINGADKADLIAGYALAFEAALRAAGYGKAADRRRSQEADIWVPPGPPYTDDHAGEPPKPKPAPEPEKPWWERSPVIRSIAQLGAWLAAGGSALLAVDWKVIAVLSVVGAAVAIYAIRYQTKATK